MKPCTIRVPATPLITHDPYFSVWSLRDRLTDDWPAHWTGMLRGAGGLIHIDGNPFTWLGTCHAPAMEQVSCEIFPTRTRFAFRAGGVELRVTFLSPLLPDDLDVLSRPLSYVTFRARPLDGRAHRVRVYLDVGAEWAADTLDQPVTWMRHHLRGLEAMRAGTLAQPVLARSGDNLRGDWGYVWMAAPSDGRQETACGGDGPIRDAFIKGQALPRTDDLDQPGPVFRSYPKLATALDLGRVSSRGAEAWLMVAYEDQFCCEYMRRRLRPYWQRGERTMADLLLAAAREMPTLARRSEAFDRRLLADAEAAGGPEYRDLCALAYRQAIAAHKLAADFDGSPLFLSKENFSNGCVATVDVTYPSAPLFLLVSPPLLEAMLTPVMEYAASPRWRFPFAPHDLGTFPLANGQVYGGAEKTEHNQMPVEESGNMLLLVAALCRARGDLDYARTYWALLTRWARYLEGKGFDPESQLCTDDFAGHLAHNANLSIKAILALAAYAKLADKLGHRADAARLTRNARAMARRWMRQADDGDHSRLAFDKPGSWSQKYNLVWDRLLDLRIFPPTVARREVAHYLRSQGRFGLPLDSRKTYTKLDWIVWSATLAERRTDFEKFIRPIHAWLQQTASRVPLTDWYETGSGDMVAFRARSVVGGVFIRMLADPRVRARWRKKSGS